MNRIASTALLATALCAGAAQAATDVITEQRPVDARVVKIKLGGVLELNVHQGATASLVISGDKAMVQKITTTVSGDTLVIDMEKVHSFSWGNNKQVRAELTLPSLTEFTSSGVGATTVSGFSGDSVKLALDGAGAVTVTSHYRNVNAHLGGVGSMTLNTGDTDSIDLALRGAGQVTINGQSKLLRAHLGGVGSLEAKDLHADAVDVDMTGLGSAKVYAKTSANLNLSGLGSATVYGKPTKRTSSARGLGSVTFE